MPIAVRLELGGGGPLGLVAEVRIQGRANARVGPVAARRAIAIERRTRPSWSRSRAKSPAARACRPVSVKLVMSGERTGGWGRIGVVFCGSGPFGHTGYPRPERLISRDFPDTPNRAYLPERTSNPQVAGSSPAGGARFSLPHAVRSRAAFAPRRPPVARPVRVHRGLRPRSPAELGPPGGDGRRVKKLGRIQGGAGHRMTGRRHYNPRSFDLQGKRRCTVGWDFVHIAIDDCTRLAYAEVLPDEKASTAIAFLGRGRVPPPPRHHRRAPAHRQRLNNLLGSYN
jgi:hypothetical protein